MISNLRIFGILVGLISFILGFFIIRGHRWNRFNFVLMLIFSTSLIAVSINPNIVNILRRMLNLEQTERGRIITLLIYSNIILWLFIFYLKNALDTQKVQFDKLVRSIGSEKHLDLHQKKFEEIGIAVLIPAYNEADNLRELLPKIPRKIVEYHVGILVVDDGSEDDTFDVAFKAGVPVVKNVINRGGGAALRLGYDILLKEGVKICVTMDADCQHKPEDIEKLVIPIIEDRYDFIIGSRIMGAWERDSKLKKMGLWLFSLAINKLLGTQITDPSSGFRAFNMNCLKKVSLYEDQYHTSELIITAVKEKLRIGEVPITILRRKYGKSKKGRTWKYGLNFAKVIMKAWWR
jgi:hypothetical protein